MWSKLFWFSLFKHISKCSFSFLLRNFHEKLNISVSASVVCWMIYFKTPNVVKTFTLVKIILSITRSVSNQLFCTIGIKYFFKFFIFYFSWQIFINSSKYSSAFFPNVTSNFTFCNFFCYPKKIANSLSLFIFSLYRLSPSTSWHWSLSIHSF